MSHDLTIPLRNGTSLSINLANGKFLFLLGANGTGKSSLLQHFATQNTQNARRISAHRKTTMSSDSLDLTPTSKMQTERNIQSQEHNYEARFRDDYADVRASMVVFDLIDAENVRARAIASAYDAKDDAALRTAGIKQAPLTILNEILQLSNIPVKISIQENERIVATRPGGQTYSAAQLSDGERNALLIAGNVLTAKPGSLFLIDEPERHLHRSIVVPLLSQLFSKRNDCAFVVSTHDHGLPFEHTEASVVLVRACKFENLRPIAWDADILEANIDIDESVLRDILGARRKVLFVEGTASSLDLPLYSAVFPLVSIFSKGNCREVENSVFGARSAESLHWLSVFGLVDGDGYSDAQLKDRLSKGVFALPFYSVEAIYYHQLIIEEVAKRQAKVNGRDSGKITDLAIQSGLAEIAKEVVRHSRNIAKRRLRNIVYSAIPNDEELLKSCKVNIEADSQALVSLIQSQIESAISEKNWTYLLKVCQVKNSGATGAISQELGFRNRSDYEAAVRFVLSTDANSLEMVRGFFNGLYESLIQS